MELATQTAASRRPKRSISAPEQPIPRETQAIAKLPRAHPERNPRLANTSRVANPQSLSHQNHSESFNINSFWLFPPHHLASFHIIFFNGAWHNGPESLSETWHFRPPEWFSWRGCAQPCPPHPMPWLRRWPLRGASGCSRAVDIARGWDSHCDQRRPGTSLPCPGGPGFRRHPWNPSNPWPWRPWRTWRTWDAQVEQPPLETRRFRRSAVCAVCCKIFGVSAAALAETCRGAVHNANTNWRQPTAAGRLRVRNRDPKVSLKLDNGWQWYITLYNPKPTRYMDQIDQLEKAERFNRLSGCLPVRTLLAPGYIVCGQRSTLNTRTTGRPQRWHIQYPQYDQHA